MNLKQFLQLNPIEELQKNTIINYKKFLSENDFNNLIKRYDTALLFKLAITSPNIAEFCRAPALSDYWRNLWRRCGVNPQENAILNGETIHEYQPMATVLNSFDLLLGLYLYDAYRKNLEQLQDDLGDLDNIYKESEEYLAASASYGCFFSLNALCVEGLALLKKKFDEQIAMQVLQYANKAAELYLSAGYLLLANVCQELIPMQSKLKLFGIDLRMEVLKAMEIARKLEVISGPMINNAYQGKTLHEASHGKIDGFLHAEKRIIAALEFSPSEIDVCSIQAKKIASDILKSHEKNVPTTSDDEIQSSRNQI